MVALFLFLWNDLAAKFDDLRFLWFGFLLITLAADDDLLPEVLRELKYSGWITDALFFKAKSFLGVYRLRLKSEN